MKRFFILFSLIVLLISSDSNAWDTTAAKFYPIQSGNAYFYKKISYDLFCGHGLDTQYLKVTIDSDSLMPNGKKYFKFSGFNYFSCWNYQRIDSNSMNVYGYYNGADVLLDSLLGISNNFFRGKRNYVCTFPVKVDVLTNYLLFNSPPFRKAKYVQNDNREATYFYFLVENFGLCEVYNCELDTGFNLSTVGCIINGVVYGDTTLTGIQKLSSFIPENFSLSQNYPNPFNPNTIINYSIPSNVKRETSNVKLVVYNNLGKEIATLVNEKQNAGSYEVEFNGEGFPSGVYFYNLVVSSSNSLSTTDFAETKRMILLK